jgi:hypothetical protein
MHSAGVIGAAGKSIDPSARKKRGPQDDNVEGVGKMAMMSKYLGLWCLLENVWPNPGSLGAAARICAHQKREGGRKARLARDQGAFEQGQDHAEL